MSFLAFAPNLRRLLWLRVVMMLTLVLASFIAAKAFDIMLPVMEVASALGLMLVVNFISWLRLWRRARIHDLELLLQLLLDIALLTWLFYATGGYSNPFVWMYLLPLSVAAVSLSWRHTWLIAALVIAAYSLLMFWYEPLAIHSHMHLGASYHEHDEGFGLHLLGMWCGFVVSAAVMAFFVERMGRNLREYDKLLAESREKVLASERMLALGTLATGAAHELGTPLSTMAVLTQELSQEYQHDPELSSSLSLLRKQIERCKEILSSITASAGMMRSESTTVVPLQDFITQLTARWQDMRPATPLELDCQLPQPTPVIVADLALGQSIINLINNAADASPEGISMLVRLEHEILSIVIQDSGRFPSADSLALMGTLFHSTKQHSGGLGLGIFLAKSVLDQFDGEVTFHPREPHGTLTRIRIPLRKLRLTPAP